MIFNFETLKITKPSKYVLLVILNRPENSNAFNTQMGIDLYKLFESFSIDDHNIRSIVLTGSGNKAFCAGGDLKERNNMKDVEWKKQHLIFERMIRAIINCPIPCIAAVNGAAYGGGCELAAAMDFIFASENAKFAQTKTKLGIIPGAGGTQNLTRAIGERKAKEYILTARPFGALEALNFGLVNKVFEQTKLLENTISVAKQIAENAPIAIRQAKQAIHKGLQMSLHDGLSFEIEAYNRTISTEDRYEGVLAFNEKRQPKFKGK